MRIFILAFLLCGGLALTQTTAADPAQATDAAQATADPAQTAADQAAQEKDNAPLADYDSFDNPVNLKDPADQTEPQAPQIGGNGSMGDLYLKMFGSLLLVLGLMLGLAWAAKRFLPKQLVGMTQGDNLRVVQSLPLGPKRYVSIIEADGQRILIGVTEERISLIKSLDEKNFEKALMELDEPKRVRDWEEGA